jgi:hypothetical protein
MSGQMAEPTMSGRARPTSPLRTASISSRPTPKICSAYWNTTRPMSVSASDRPWRWKSEKPITSSSSLIWVETVGCERRSFSLALETLPSRAVIQK